MNRNDKVTDESYLDYIRSLPCLVPLCRLGEYNNGKSDPHHLKAVGWREAKRNDYTAVPLCRQHHSEVEQTGMEKFCAKYSIDELWKDALFILVGYLKENPPAITL